MQIRSRVRGAVKQILVLTQLYPPSVGGTPVLFESIYSRLAATGVRILTDALPGTEDAQDGNGLWIVRRPLRTAHWGLLNPEGLAHHVRVAREVRRLGSRSRVVVHCGRALPEGVAAWLSRWTGGPDYLCWAHGEDIGTARQSRELTWVMTRVYRGASAVIANSRSSARMLEALGVPPERIHVVHPGVDVNRFRPDVDAADLRARFAARSETVLLSVGRLQRRKGHDSAIAAIALLKEQGVPIQYLVIGVGDERQRLEALASISGVDDCVHFLGEVSAAELPRYYAACDVFLLPNRDENGDVEGFGIVFLEAAAAGRPSIGGRSGGVPEAVIDGQTGVLVSGTDLDELAAAICDLAGSDRTRRQLGAKGRERACREFDWDRAARQVLAVHQRVSLNLA